MPAERGPTGGNIGQILTCIPRRCRFMIAPPFRPGFTMSHHTALPLLFSAPRTRAAGVLLAALLSACVPLEQPEPSAESLALAGEVRTEMARCVDALGDSERALDQQAQRLAQQDAKLEAMHDDLRALQTSAAGASESNPSEPERCEEDGGLGTKLLVGRQERVWLEDFNLSLPARVDTGAETASLDARNIALFERNGDPWVRFEIVHPESGGAVPLEKRMVRKARIIQANSEQAERRPVISLGIVIGSVRQQAEFTLSNRSHLDYQVLVGRNILADMMIVDVSQTNIAPPQVERQRLDSSP